MGPWTGRLPHLDETVVATRTLPRTASSGLERRRRPGAVPAPGLDPRPRHHPPGPQRRRAHATCCTGPQAGRAAGDVRLAGAARRRDRGGRRPLRRTSCGPTPSPPAGGGSRRPTSCTRPNLDAPDDAAARRGRPSRSDASGRCAGPRSRCTTPTSGIGYTAGGLAGRLRRPRCMKRRQRELGERRGRRCGWRATDTGEDVVDRRRARGHRHRRGHRLVAPRARLRRGPGMLGGTAPRARKVACMTYHGKVTPGGPPDVRELAEPHHHEDVGRRLRQQHLPAALPAHRRAGAHRRRGGAGPDPSS